MTTEVRGKCRKALNMSKIGVRATNFAAYVHEMKVIRRSLRSHILRNRGSPIIFKKYNGSLTACGAKFHQLARF